MQCCISFCTGLRNSSTGVPMVMTTGPVWPIAPGDDVNSSLLPANALANSGAAPCSINGSLPALMVASAVSLRSLILTVRPASAKARTSGIPTWPAPPTTVIFAVCAPVGPDGAVLVDAIFNWVPYRPSWEYLTKLPCLGPAALQTDQLGRFPVLS